MKLKKVAIFLAILAAALYAINIPLAKIILKHAEPVFTAGFLYLGAGIGMLIYSLIKLAIHKKPAEDKLTKHDLLYTIMMVVLDIAAPILLMFGVKYTNSANVSLLNNFEIVATALIAFLIFKEKISKKLLAAIILIVISSVLLTFEGTEALEFNLGSLFVIGASLCWGLENNCTRKISDKSSEEIVIIKGIFSGLSSIIIALIIGEKAPNVEWVFAILALGFVAYGLSINFYVMAQKYLGAAKTSAFYSVAPFIGVIFSLIILEERPMYQFYIALAIMLIATLIIVKDTLEIEHKHMHAHTHTHVHSHGTLVHCHEHTHYHSHDHVHHMTDKVHNHEHDLLELEDHIHEHIPY